MNIALLYIGSIVVTIWGIVHLFPTKSIIAGFGEISVENKRTLAMAWIGESVGLIAMGGLIILITALGSINSSLVLLVYRYIAIVLLILAVISFFTGFRNSIIPMKICPFVKLLGMVLILLGSGV